jgi:protein-disulfide isomerase
MVYNWRDVNRLEGRTLIGTGPDLHKRGGVLLILVALLATVSYLTGCTATGSGGSSQAPEEQQASRTTGSPEQKSEASGRVSAGRLGHPAIGSPDAPVVLIEYADYQ